MESELTDKVIKQLRSDINWSASEIRELYGLNSAFAEINEKNNWSIKNWHMILGLDKSFQPERNMIRFHKVAGS